MAQENYSINIGSLHFRVYIYDESCGAFFMKLNRVRGPYVVTLKKTLRFKWYLRLDYVLKT